MIHNQIQGFLNVMSTDQIRIIDEISRDFGSKTYFSCNITFFKHLYIIVYLAQNNGKLVWAAGLSGDSPLLGGYFFFYLLYFSKYNIWIRLCNRETAGNCYIGCNRVSNGLAIFVYRYKPLIYNIPYEKN